MAAYYTGISDAGLTLRKIVSFDFSLCTCTETTISSSLSVYNGIIERVNSDQRDEDTTVSDLSASQFDYV